MVWDRWFRSVEWCQVTASSVITRSPSGGYDVATKSNADPLSALFVTPRYAATLWGARRLARKHQRYLAKCGRVSAFREVIE